MDVLEKKQAIKGGEFLIRPTDPQDVFIVEEFQEEQLMMVAATRDFIASEITPHVERMDSMEEGFMAGLLEKAGELGLLAVGVPEEYGGLGMSFNTSMLIADIMGGTGSYSTAHGAHTGIGTLPIQYYGTEAQKARYLPKLATGAWKACYCLTEPDAGSDANSGKTKARLNEAGTHYLINGQKMWISNAGFADVFIVFAKVGDDKNHSAFIVERSFGGITMNDEEKKMGIKGSSTRQVFFNDCPVPVENMLSERGNGFKIAVNILNIGRIKLAAGCIGGAKVVIDQAVNYSNERVQFGQPISAFGAIKHKLAEMAVRTYATEAATYRAGQDIEDKIEDLKAQGMDKEQAMLKGVEQFAIECAIMKCHASEVLDYVTDEGVQVYGGMGFSADAPMERAYRDARITRIYEGTNEINRMLLVGMLLKRAMKSELALFEAAKQIGDELMAMPAMEEPSDTPLAAEQAAVEKLKKATLMVLGKAAQKLGKGLQQEQEIMMALAEMVIEVYVAESTLLRTRKLIALRGEAACKGQKAMTQAYVYQAIEKVATYGREAIFSFAQEDELKVLLLGLKRYTKPLVLNPKALRRSIADEMIHQNKYPY